MSDFDRELAACIGRALADIDREPIREVVAKCYAETLRKLDGQESEDVSEKWIDYVWQKVAELRIAGKNSDQIARSIFELIAKA